jgi:hypothetical protein
MTATGAGKKPTDGRLIMLWQADQVIQWIFEAARLAADETVSIENLDGTFMFDEMAKWAWDYGSVEPQLPYSHEFAQAARLLYDADRAIQAGNRRECSRALSEAAALFREDRSTEN